MSQTTKTKMRPIPFSDPMVCAVIENRKKQTRRIMSHQPSGASIFPPTGDSTTWYFRDHRAIDGENEIGRYVKCPYGKTGDQLWVRETYYQQGHWEEMPGVKTKGGRTKWRFVPNAPTILYDAPTAYRKGRHHKDPGTVAWHKRLARFMPRAASRITLKITGIRVQKLQAISEMDAKAEGVQEHIYPACGDHPDLVGYVTAADGEWGAAHITRAQAFAKLWDSINGDKPGCAWKSNPHVWVVEFKVLSTTPTASGDAE